MAAEPGALPSQFPDFQCQSAAGYQHANVFPPSFSPPAPTSRPWRASSTTYEFLHLRNCALSVGRTQSLTRPQLQRRQHCQEKKPPTPCPRLTRPSDGVGCAESSPPFATSSDADSAQRRRADADGSTELVDGAGPSPVQGTLSPNPVQGTISPSWLTVG